ncbi:hypothetical protein [Devosia sp.]|uniref:hypothetical protein n=1 Tax=Devosia sp. TaxID=1871048 RepID=UPI003F6FC165
MDTSTACCDSCAGNAQDTALAIACTLGSADLKERVAGIRELAQRSLRSSRRTSLTLELVYERTAIDEVGELVAKESECCSFLAFDLKGVVDGVRLRITVPESEAFAADELFAHFAPELAREVA